MKFCFLLLGIFVFLILNSTAQAACSSPTGGASQTRYDFTANKMYYCNNTDWVEMGGSGGGSNSIVAGWPDAIRCTSGATTVVLFSDYAPFGGNNLYIYRAPHTGNTYDSNVSFTAGKTYHSSGGAAVGSDCVNKTIEQLYSSGQAFNLVGGGGGGSATPPGAIMAFDLTSCPTGWTEYTAARGRFLRGIDSTGTIDPDGVRVKGSLQNDDFKSHKHASVVVASSGLYMGSGAGGTGTPSANTYLYAGNGTNNAAETSEVGGAETRPKNVAVLYCRKN